MDDASDKGQQRQPGELTDVEKAERNEAWLDMQRHEAILLSGIKGLAVLNSAGVAAMLGFLQALISKPEAFAAFRISGTIALALYLMGAIAGTLHFYPHAKFIVGHVEDRARRTTEASVFLTAAVFGVVLGSAAALYGVAFKL